MYSTAVNIIIFITTVTVVKLDSEVTFSTTGGTIAEDGEFPFVVSIRNPNGVHLCGGSLISENWVLTAAMCIQGTSPETLYVAAGTNRLHSGQGILLGVTEGIRHEDYSPESNVNNIALLKLKADKLTDKAEFIEVIELKKDYIDGSQDCTAVGWGLVKSQSQSVLNDLEFLNTKSLAVGECHEALPEYPMDSLADICTLTGKGQGICEGGIGGPLVIKEEGKFKLIAVIGSDISCRKELPTIYSRMSYYYDWIGDTVKNNN